MDDSRDDGTRGPGRRMLAASGLAAVGAVGLLAGAMREARAQPAAAVSDYAWGDAIRRIKAAGKVVFGMAGNPVPPQYYHDPHTNQPAGFDADVARLIAKDLGVEPVFEEVVTPARIVGLQAGKYDIGLGGTANTPARAFAVAFTRGYIPYQQVVMVNTNSKVAAVDDLNKPGVTITAMMGSTAEYAARERFPKATVKPLNINEAMLEVASGRADANLVELYLAGPFTKAQPSAKILGGSDKPTITATEYGCLICRNSEMGLREWLDNWLYWYDSHGILGGMYDRTVGAALRGETIR